MFSFVVICTSQELMFHTDNITTCHVMKENWTVQISIFFIH